MRVCINNKNLFITPKSIISCKITQKCRFPNATFIVKYAKRLHESSLVNGIQVKKNWHLSAGLIIRNVVPRNEMKGQSESSFQCSTHHNELLAFEPQ
ncbi:hypothetical protein EMIT0194MI4_30555 [Pseudomonas sp. IT-194MI4]